MDISSRLSQYGRLALNKTIVGKDDKNNRQPSEPNKDDKKGSEEFVPVLVEADALSLLAMQNRALVNINYTIEEAPAPANAPAAANAPSMNAPAVSGGNSGIDIDSLFDGADSINSKDFIARFESWKNSTNPSEQQLYDLFNTAINRFNIYNKYDEQFMFEAFIKVLNDELGETNTNPPTLTKEAVNKLNQNDPFGTIERILNDEKFEIEYYVGSIDGEIDSFSQGQINDCYMLACIKALSSFEKGKEFLKSSIKEETDKITGEKIYRVRLDEDNWSDPITLDDIKNAKKNGKFAKGDTDILLYEIANEKYGFDGAVFERYAGYKQTQSLPTNFLKYQYEEFKNGDVACICSFANPISVTDIDGNSYYFTNGHAYAITDMYIDNNNPGNSTITIVNPWDSEQSITLTWEEFAKTNSHIVEYYNPESNAINMEQVFNAFDNGDIDINNFSIILQEIKLQHGFSIEEEKSITDKVLEAYVNGNISDTFDVYWQLNYMIKINKDVLVNSFIENCAKSKNSKMQTAVVHTLLRLGYDVLSEGVPLRFTIDGKTYEVYTKFNSDNDKKVGKYQTLNTDEIVKYTTDQSLIDKYFEVAASVDGQPLIYRLKDGMSFADFKREAKGNTGITRGHKDNFGKDIKSIIDQDLKVEKFMYDIGINSNTISFTASLDK